MSIRKVIRKSFSRTGDGVNVVGGVTGAIAANVNEDGGSTHVSSHQKIVQRDGRTEVESETTEERTRPPHPQPPVAS